jgi:hypothetical protein
LTEDCQNNPNCNTIQTHGDIEGWCTSEVTDMYKLFDKYEMHPNAVSFNKSLKNWNTSKVTTMNGMFSWAAAFDQSLKEWDISKVTNVQFMFQGASAFNQDLCSWGKVPSFPYGAVTDMFKLSGCANKANPTQGGSFCAECTTILF